VGSYVSGTDLERVSKRDFQRYDDSGVNRRVADSYGAVIAAHGEDLPIVLGSPATQRIDHSGRRLRVEMAKGIRNLWDSMELSNVKLDSMQPMEKRG
jgi:monoamine oxidase